MRDTRTPLATNTVQLLGRAAIIALLMGRVGVVAIPIAFAAMAAVETAAQEAGYTAALALGGGWFLPTRVNRWAVPRENIPSGLSENGFVIRSSGL